MPRLSFLVLAMIAAGSGQTAPVAVVIGDFVRHAIGGSPPDPGDPVVKVLPARDRELGVIAAIEVRAGAGQLVEAIDRLEHLLLGDAVIAAGRFSDVPIDADLAGLRWPAGDLEDLPDCRPGHCALKLSDQEIAHTQQVIHNAGDNWRPVAERALKQIVLDRVRAFRDRGSAGVGPYHDKREPVRLDDEFAALLSTMTYVGGETAAVVDYLRRYPNGRLRPAREFYYWSLESLGLKPVISVTRISIFELPSGRNCERLVVSTQVFATHYVTASLSMMTILGGVPSGPGLFVYANRSRIDGLQGWFGGMVRRKVEGRIRTAAPGALVTMRRRLERQPPPLERQREH